MVNPTRHRQLEELDLAVLCTQILSDARNELYMNMHFLALSLSSLGFEADTSVFPVGTDGERIYYHPEALCQLYRRGRVYVNRAYLHMVLHCVFCHWDTKGSRTEEGWNLACDIAMESIIDGLYKKCVHAAPSPFRRETYLRLKKEMEVLTAEGIYQALQNRKMTEKQYQRLRAEFLVDSHKRWYEEPPKSQTIPRQSRWKDNREKLQTQMEAMGQETAQSDEGSLLEQVRIENQERYDYRRFLKKFAVLKEELQVDEDSFDYIYYTYGLSHYGNMPLIEPLESKEIFRIQDFVIVIDTSMSCSGALVKQFLEETYGILSESESFFHKVNIHIVQCDDVIRSDVVVSNPRQMEDYMRNFTIKGKGGTDFRPAFEYVDSLCAQGAFTRLKGLLYFTDGQGLYPVKPPPYDTAFIFVREREMAQADGMYYIRNQYPEASVPSWAMKVVLDSQELGKSGKRGVEV